MKNEYHDMMERIHTPDGLNERVLSAARQQAEKTIPHRRQSVWRVAVCAALALALVLGSVTLRPVDKNSDSDKIEYSESFDVLPFMLTYEFGLATQAADVSSANGGLAFAWVEDGADFRIEGVGIETVSLSVEKGALWRAGICFGRTVTETFDPSAVYGLRLAEDESDISAFDGTALRVTAVFADGVKQMKTFTLSTDELQVTRDEKGIETYFLTLAGDTAETISGLYVSSEESCWLQWPVAGSSTVSLSNRYGYRTVPGGQEGAFHAGIDIPAGQGTAITAAAAGTVIKAEFDADKGNYIILDHGNGMETVYAQCLRLAVEVGDTVEAGEEIAAVGSTGKSTGPHLCFQVWQDGEAQNPVAYFDSDVRDTLKMG